MLIVQADVPVNCTAVFDDPNPAFVGMSVYDDTGPSPVLIQMVIPMVQVVSSIFRGKFTPKAGKLYIAFMAVYTDETFEVLDPLYALQEQAFGFQAQYLSPPVQNVVGLVGCNFPDDISACAFQITQGDVKTIFLRVINSTLGMLPLDLTNCTEIEVALPKADGSFTSLKLTQGAVFIAEPKVLGQFSVPISADISELLNAAQYQNFNATITMVGGAVFTVRFLDAFSVYNR